MVKDNFKPFRITIAGRTIKEVVHYAKEFIAEFEEQTTQDDYGQTSLAMDTMVDHITEHVVTVEVPKFDDNPFGNAPPAPAYTPTAAPLIATPQATLTTGEVDSAGLPWDERIHASSLAKSKDGKWRYRRNVEDSVINEVEFELRGAAKAGVAPVVTYPSRVVENPLVPPVMGIPPELAVVAQPVMASPAPPLAVVPPLRIDPPIAVPPPAAAPMPAPAQPVALPAAYTFESFNEHFVPALGKLVSDGKITREYIVALERHAGIEGIWNATLEQRREIFDMFVSHGLLAKAL